MEYNPPGSHIGALYLHGDFNEKCNIDQQWYLEGPKCLIDVMEQSVRCIAEENKAKLEFTASENQKDRENNIITSEIRAAGYGAASDINENKVSDYQDALKDIKLDSEKREEMNFKREQASMKNSHDKSKLEIEREKLAAQMDVANKNLEIARVNKNKYDVKKPKK